MSLARWMILVMVFGIALAMLYQAGRETFRAEITIPASADEVWRVLVDAEGYKEWHPLLLPIEGSFKEGDTITYEMSQPDGERSTFITTITILDAGKHLKQYAGVPLVLTAEHEYRLESVPEGTRVIQYEVDNGLGMLFWDSSWVQPTYEQVNLALKARVLELLER